MCLVCATFCDLQTATCIPSSSSHCCSPETSLLILDKVLITETREHLSLKKMSLPFIPNAKGIWVLGCATHPPRHQGLHHNGNTGAAVVGKGRGGREEGDDALFSPSFLFFFSLSDSPDLSQLFLNNFTLMHSYICTPTFTLVLSAENQSCR